MAQTLGNLGGSSASEKSAEYIRLAPRWEKIRDALEGEDRIKELDTVYLPKPKGLDSSDYQNYKERASFYAVSDRTLRGLVGSVFRIRPRIELTARLSEFEEVITPDGLSVQLLVRDIFREVVSVGRYGMLVDLSPVETTTPEPHISTYRAEDILKWEETVTRGRRTLTRVVVQDQPSVAGSEESQRLLELMMIDGVYTINVFVAVEPEKRRTVPEPESTTDLVQAGFEMIDSLTPMMAGSTMSFIPFIFINTFDLRPTPGKPPFLDLTNINIAHYRNSADYEHALYLTAQPTPYIAGNISKEDRPTSIGSGTIWFLPDGAEAGMVEFTGKGLEASRTAMEDKEGRMAFLGARLIKEAESPTPRTAETTRLEARGETSVLESAIGMTEAGAERALKIAADWLGDASEGVSVRLNRDLVETRLSGPELTALVASWSSEKAISYDTLWENLQKGEIADTERTAEEERERIEEETKDEVSELEGIRAELAAMRTQMNGGAGPPEPVPSGEPEPPAPEA